MPACQEQRFPAAKGPRWAFQHWDPLLSQAAASRPHCERKATNAISLPAQVSTGAFPITVHAWFPAFCQCHGGVVVLILFRVQTPVQHLLSTVTAANPPHGILTEADGHIRLGLYTLLPLHFYLFPILVFSWRAGVGGALSTATAVLWLSTGSLQAGLVPFEMSSPHFFVSCLPVNDYPVSKLSNNSVPETSEKKKICTNGREGS